MAYLHPIQRFKLQMLPERSKSIDFHPTLLCSAFPDWRFCAHSHCRGECKFPALFIRAYYGDDEVIWHSMCSKDEDGRHYIDYKTIGSMVAYGPAFQPKNFWGGARVYVPNDYDLRGLVENMWWR